MVENLEFDTFHSIPYRRDGLPECPIDLHNSIGKYVHCMSHVCVVCTALIIK